MLHIPKQINSQWSSTISWYTVVLDLAGPTEKVIYFAWRVIQPSQCSMHLNCLAYVCLKRKKKKKQKRLVSHKMPWIIGRRFILKRWTGTPVLHYVSFHLCLAVGRWSWSKNTVQKSNQRGNFAWFCTVPSSSKQATKLRNWPKMSPTKEVTDLTCLSSGIKLGKYEVKMESPAEWEWGEEAGFGKVGSPALLLAG